MNSRRYRTILSTQTRAFVNTHLLIHKHVKISVDKWILEITHPQKHVKFLEQFHKFSIPKSNFGRRENEKCCIVLGILCSAHRLELCYKDAMKKVPMAEKVLTLLTGLYYMYRNSPLNRTNLKNAFRCLSINIKLPT